MAALPSSQAQDEPRGFAPQSARRDSMRTLFRLLVVSLPAILAATIVPLASAANTNSIDRDSAAALKALYDKTPAAKALCAKAKGVLVFPRIVKAGLVVGGQGGEGALIRNGKTVGYYGTAGMSVGLQAGAQAFGYALFFMSDSALNYVKNSDGWEIGVGPSIVILDSATARALTTTTAHADVYAFFFDQQGLMAGMGLQGTKIYPIQQ
jgi:lipid-binding SYLF domain-containing protein